MSDKLGPMAYGENQQEVFLGHAITQNQNVSEATARLIDSEIRRIVDEGYAGAQQIISTNLDRLHDLANALLEHETLTGDEVGAVLRGEPLPKASAQEAAGAGAAAPSGRRGSVPTTAPPKDDAGGMEPSPQPGA
jgi:cell division protease FtsH